MKNFEHIHQVLIDAGYPETHETEWYIQIKDYESQRPLIISHWYDCGTKERAKIAVKSLLNRAGVYEVTVFSPLANPISFYGGRFNGSSERTWAYYFDWKKN